MPKQTKSTKKVVASKGGRKISTPIKLLFISLGVLFLTIAGTYGYTKYKQRDMQAKAGAYILPDWMYENKDRKGVRFALCKTNAGPRKINLTGIVVKPQLLDFYADKHIAGLSVWRGSNFEVQNSAWYNISGGEAMSWLILKNVDLDRDMRQIRFYMSFVTWKNSSTPTYVRTLNEGISLSHIPHC